MGYPLSGSGTKVLEHQDVGEVHEAVREGGPGSRAEDSKTLRSNGRLAEDAASFG